MARKTIPGFVIGSVLFGVLVSRTQSTARLDLELEWKGPKPTLLQVFWAPDGQDFTEKNSVKTAGYLQRHIYDFDIPLDTNQIRIDPSNEVGDSVLYSAKIKYVSFDILSWNSALSWADRGLGVWRGKEDLTDIKSDGDALQLHPSGSDPQLILLLQEPIQTKTFHFVLLASLAVGLFCSLLQILWMAVVRAAMSVAWRSWKKDLWRNLALATASTATAGVAAFFIYKHFTEKFTLEHGVADQTGYEVSLVDRRARPLFVENGTLLLNLDAFSQFRNLPNQHTPFFSVDKNGFRGSFDADSEEPVAVALGGSSTFGAGLSGDDQTFSGQLNQKKIGYQFVNDGIVASLSGQVLSEMIHHADNLKPSLYIVMNGWNDLFGQYYVQDPGHTVGSSPVSWEIENKLWNLFKSSHPKAGTFTALKPAAPVKEDEILPKIFKAYVSNIDKMDAFARGRGAKLLVIQEPHLNGKEHFSPDEQKAWNDADNKYKGRLKELSHKYEAMLAYARTEFTARGISFITPQAKGPFRESKDTVFSDVIHPNHYGHGVIANEIAQWIEKSGIKTKTVSQAKQHLRKSL